MFLAHHVDGHAAAGMVIALEIGCAWLGLQAKRLNASSYNQIP